MPNYFPLFRNSLTIWITVIDVIDDVPGLEIG